MLVIGNWKMNPPTLGEAKKLFLAVRKGLRHRPKYLELVVAPPSPYLSEIERLSPSQRIALAAQATSEQNPGPHTGEISVSMLKSVGVSYVIVGHSEMRARGLSDEIISLTLKVILKNKLTPVLCVGERARDTNGDYFSLVETQLVRALQGLARKDLKNLIIAYEPVWAIGTGKNATAEDVSEMNLFIEKVLADQFGRPVARNVRLIYGGSVNSRNVDGLLEQSTTAGFLVGGASLKPAEFLSIIKSTNQHAKKHLAKN